MRKEHKQFFEGLPTGIISMPLGKYPKHRIRHMEFFVDPEEFEKREQVKDYRVNYLNGTPYVFVQPLDKSGNEVPVKTTVHVEIDVPNPPRGVAKKQKMPVEQVLRPTIINPHGEDGDMEGGYIGFTKMKVDDYKQAFMSDKKKPVGRPPLSKHESRDSL